MTSLRERVASTLGNHRRQGYEVRVSIDEVLKLYKTTTHCKYCGCAIGMRRGTQEDSSSLDRINNEQVITKDNIQVICKRCNTTKGSRTHTEFLAYLRRLVELNQE